ncbi:amino acid permease [Lyngbya sp. CCY1209]|uniref:APC family permease n=1 Tax=Lyngbya sp. CCY1209 TaxID=2886103 RepID=UPI002D2076E4|nr:amino acid permease [Lyngbya sp. CCY1209]MEB3885881.1 amino acid permease [Lyngbya sp. CCY1209]
MPESASILKRELGVFGATLMGLGSILGTGVFVSIGIAAGISGPAVILAIALAAMVAVANGLSSAQLAANHPVSGGTYEYGYRYLTPELGFVAGWMFLLAKSASAATAALGFSGYVLNASGGEGVSVPLALAAVAGLTAVVLGGLRRSNIANIAIVSITLLSLSVFILSGLPVALSAAGSDRLTPFFPVENPVAALLQGTALMFVAYTGYGRIATLGEEVREPRRTIPRAIIVTMSVTMVLYVGVAWVAVATAGAAGLGAAPLEVASRAFGVPGLPQLVALGAIAAMLGVLLNLILGLSRVLLAMGRRGDMPARVGRLNASGTTPTAAVVVMGTTIALLVLIGNLKITWSLSAFNVLIYYGITNWAALRLSPEERLYPRWIAGVGLAACFFLAFWVEWRIWVAGVLAIAIGALWRAIVRSRGRS